jgi:predicted GNAT family acetyltransferase
MSVPSRFFSGKELARLIDETAVQGCLAWRAWPELEIHEEPGVLQIRSGVPFLLFNVVLKTRIDPDEAYDRIDSIQAWAKKMKISLGWYTTPCTRPFDMGDRLLSKDFVLGGGSAGMAVDLRDIKENLPRPETLSIEEVRDLDTLKIWSRVMTSVYGFPDFAAQSWFRLHAAMGLGADKSWHHYLARMGETPVATSSLFLGSDAAMIASVATIPAARCKGAGTAVIHEPLQEARHREYSTAVTCSSEMGEDIYRNIGFEDICEMKMYLWSGE